MMNTLLTAVVLSAVAVAAQAPAAVAAAPATTKARLVPAPEAKRAPKPEAKPAPKPEPVEVLTAAEAQAKAAYDAAETAAKEAETALAPFRAAMQKADGAFAEASKAANAKRQKATDAKNLAGELGAKELKQAEDDVPTASKALIEAINAKPDLEKALVDAKAAALPLRQAYDTAEKEATQSKAVAKAAADAANKLDDEARIATAQAAGLRHAAEAAKAALARARQSVPDLQKRADVAAKKLAEAEATKKAADAALTSVKDPAARQNAQEQIGAAAQRLARATAEKRLADAALASVQEQITAAVTGIPVAEQAARAAAKSAEEKRQRAARAGPKRKAVADLAQAEEAAQQGEARVAAARQKVSEAEAQKRPADAALASAKNQVATATRALAAAENAAQEAAARAKKIASDAATPQAEKKRSAEDAAAKRRAVEATKAALAKAQEAARAPQARAAAAAQRLAEAEAQKKTPDAALASAKSQAADATAAIQAAQGADRELIQLDLASRKVAADAAAKRKAADAAKAALAPLQRKLEQAAIQVNVGAQTVTRAEARKKAAEEAVENLKKRIAAAKESYSADERAAKEAEAAAAPLKAEADKARAAYAAAAKVADEKRALVVQAKAQLYRLIAARRLTSIMESPAPARPAGRLDEIVFAKLKTLGVKPVLCSDAVFVRRAYLDLTGKLPTADEAKAFIQSTDKNKRVALIDHLLDQTAHVDYWAMKWSDILRIKAEFPVKVWPNAAQAYHRWVWESVARNKPYDQFVRELLTSSGSNFRDGPVNFYRAIQDRTPEGIAAAVGLAFMGTRIQFWPEDRRAGMAAFFSQVGYKPTSEWKEEIVFWDPLHSAAVPGSTAPGEDAVAKSVIATNEIPQALATPLAENGPLTTVFPDGVKTTVPPSRDPREAFADWLIRPQNPWFAKAAVNRTWTWVMGRGIVHEPDDIREKNPPSNPELLAYLEKELVASRYDLKRLRRLIFTSTTYQLSPIPRSERPEASANFASYLLRRVEAEVLNDALNRITGSTDLYTSAVPEPFTYIPKEMNAVELADGSVTSSFLTLFGRSSRSTGMESERVNELASPQWLFMLNSGEVQRKLQSGPKLAAMLSAGGTPSEIAEQLYLTILSRFPTDADFRAVERYAKAAGVSRSREMWIDLAWALVNSPEFLLRH
jgi:hypothetical protein